MQNPLYLRLMQGWMAMGSEVHGFIDALDLDRIEHGRAKLVADIFIDALAPTNTIIGNPSAIKHAIDTGGMSLVNGGHLFLGSRTDIVVPMIRAFLAKP